MMMGPGMMDRSEFDRLCRPGAAGFAEWRIDILEEILKPTEAQRLKFEDFKTASSEAGETMRSACPTEIPNSMVGHMRAMEKLTDAKSKAIKTFLPTLESFYSTLSTDQKDVLNSSQGRSRFWRWDSPV
jgi:negative regulator of replication initiation